MKGIEKLLRIRAQRERERVSPKLEAFRPAIIGGDCPTYIKVKGARGGRAAGAKSHSVVSLIIQIAHYYKVRVACFREIQNTIDDSVYQLIKDKVEQLRYQGWKFLDNRIISPSGSTFIFKGLKDLRASKSVKGLENIDIFFVEEASSVSMESWDILIPTIVRNEQSELWFCYNPESDFDPITVKIWNRKRDDAMLVELRPGPADNPWWNERLTKEMESDYEFDPDLAEHVWGGHPLSQGQKCVMSRVKVRGCVNRNIRDPFGGEQIGIDVARFGDDKTTIWRRKGMKVIAWKVLIKADTQEVARIAWDMADRRNDLLMLVDDTGVGGGVTDKLRDLGANVRGINFGGSPSNKDKYTSVADEMWFEFPVEEADIPDDLELIQELTSRQYSYDKRNRRQIEQKKDFKKRTGRSPDKADGLLLCFYSQGMLQIPKKDARELASRRR